MSQWKPSQGGHHAGRSRQGHSGDAAAQQAAAMRQHGPVSAAPSSVPHTDLSKPPSSTHTAGQGQAPLAQCLHCGPENGSLSISPFQPSRAELPVNRQLMISCLRESFDGYLFGGRNQGPSCDQAPHPHTPVRPTTQPQTHHHRRTQTAAGCRPESRRDFLNPYRWLQN